MKLNLHCFDASVDFVQRIPLGQRETVQIPHCKLPDFVLFCNIPSHAYFTTVLLIHRNEAVACRTEKADDAAGKRQNSSRADYIRPLPAVVSM